MKVTVRTSWLACDETGQPYHPNLLTFRWGRMLEGLKIKRVRLHDARHTCGTLMHLRGVPIAVVAAWLGHASAAFTMAVYTRSHDDALKDAGTSFRRDVTTRDTETSWNAQHTDVYSCYLLFLVPPVGLEPTLDGF